MLKTFEVHVTDQPESTLCACLLLLQLEKDELVSLKAAFLEIDSEQNGIITYPELQAVLSKHGADDKEIQKLFASMDQDRYAVLCCAMLCYAMLCYAMLCYDMLQRMVC